MSKDKTNAPIELPDEDASFNLNDFDTIYEATDITGIPDGIYTAIIDKIEMKKSSNDNDMLVIGMKLQDGPVLDKPVSTSFMLVTIKNMTFLKKAFTKLNFTPPQGWLNPWIDGEEQPPALTELLDVVCKVQIKNRADSDFPNVFINSRVDGVAGGGAVI